MESLFVVAGLIALGFWLGRKRSSAPVSSQVVLTVHRPSERYAPSSEPIERADAWEGSFWDIHSPTPVDAKLDLTYVDGNGQKTSRAVDVRQFGAWEGGVLMIGHCHMRNATRTFRSDRVSQAVDRDSGEVIADLSRYLQTKYETSGYGALHRFLDSDQEVITVLVYLAKADGAMRGPEREIIVRTCQKLAASPTVTGDLLLDVVQTVEPPSQTAFQRAVKGIAGRDPAVRQAVRDAAEEIVKTQRTVHPMEQAALTFICESLA